MDLEIEDEVTWPVLEVEAFLGELEIRHRVGTQRVVENQADEGGQSDVCVVLRKALNGGVVIERVGQGVGLPVAVESIQKGLRDGVKQRQNHEFIEKSEEKHRMGESGRQPVLGQSQPILKNKHDSLYTEGHADCHSPHRQVRLDFVVHQQVAAA